MNRKYATVLKFVACQRQREKVKVIFFMAVVYLMTLHSHYLPMREKKKFANLINFFAVVGKAKTVE